MTNEMQVFTVDLLNTILSELEYHILMCDDEMEFKYLEKTKNSLSIAFGCWNNYLIRRKIK